MCNRKDFIHNEVKHLPTFLQVDIIYQRYLFINAIKATHIQI